MFCVLDVSVEYRYKGSHGMNFKPRDNKVICSSVNCVFGRFFDMFFVMTQLALWKHSLFFCGFLPLCCCVSFLSPLPLLLKGDKRQQVKLHSVYFVSDLILSSNVSLILAKMTVGSSSSFLFLTIFSLAGSCFLFEECLFTTLLF